MEKVFKLRNGTIVLCVESAGGIYNASQLKTITSIAETNAGLVRTTEDQRLTFMIEESNIESVTNMLNEVGLTTRHYQKGLHQPVTCFGNLCSEHQQDALGAAVELTSALSSIELSTPLKVGINGCPYCCLATHTLDISVMADMNGYRMNLGGKNSQIPEMAAFMAEGIPAEELTSMIMKVVTIYKDNAQEGETLQSVMERLGATPFIKVLEPYSNDAAATTSLDVLGSSPSEEPVMEAKEVKEDNLEIAKDIEISPEELSEEIAESPELSGDVMIEEKVTEEQKTAAPKNAEEQVGIEEEAFGNQEVELEKSDLDLVPEEISVPETEESKVTFETAEPVVEDDEMAFEEKLNETIAEEETIASTEEDTNSQDRLKTLEFMESNQETAAAPVAQEELSLDEFDEEFESIGHDSFGPLPETTEVKASEPLDLDDSTEDLSFLSEDGIISKDQVASSKPSSNIRKFNPKSLSDKSGKSSGWEFSGFTVTEDGMVNLSFSTGAEMTVDLEKIQNKPDGLNIVINGQNLTVKVNEENKISIETDGMSVVLPVQAA